MALLELIAPAPDWTTALGKALERPTGVPERRSRDRGPERTEDGRQGGGGRRLADDLAWLRQALDEPHAHGLSELPDTAAVAVWRADLEGDRRSRLCRLRDRGVLDAAGFLLHESEAA
jgi:hypothetical protein